MFFFFFFQAEDGIRDRNVTGVQTCALPIWCIGPTPMPTCSRPSSVSRRWTDTPSSSPSRSPSRGFPTCWPRRWPRSEERRVGKEWRSGWGAQHEKKKEEDKLKETGELIDGI